MDIIALSLRQKGEPMADREHIQKRHRAEYPGFERVTAAFPRRLTNSGPQD